MGHQHVRTLKFFFMSHPCGSKNYGKEHRDFFNSHLIIWFRITRTFISRKPTTPLFSPSLLTVALYPHALFFNHFSHFLHWTFLRRLLSHLNTVSPRLRSPFLGLIIYLFLRLCVTDLRSAHERETMRLCTGRKLYEVPNPCAPQRLREAYFTTSICPLACSVPAKNTIIIDTTLQ